MSGSAPDNQHQYEFDRVKLASMLQGVFFDSGIELKELETLWGFDSLEQRSSRARLTGEVRPTQTSMEIFIAEMRERDAAGVEALEEFYASVAATLPSGKRKMDELRDLAQEAGVILRELKHVPATPEPEQTPQPDPRKPPAPRLRRTRGWRRVPVWARAVTIALVVVALTVGGLASQSGSKSAPDEKISSTEGADTAQNEDDDDVDRTPAPKVKKPARDRPEDKADRRDQDANKRPDKNDKKTPAQSSTAPVATTEPIVSTPVPTPPATEAVVDPVITPAASPPPQAPEPPQKTVQNNNPAPGKQP